MCGPLQITVSRHFLAWLHERQVSLAFTTYQTNRLFLIGLKADGTLSAFERFLDRPMGLAVSGERLYVSTRWQIWQLDNALPPHERYREYDRLYTPRLAYTTGDLDVHDLAPAADGRLIFVNTAYSCLATPSERYSFTPVWQPPFISDLVPEDRCHLNGLALADGAPAYVTTVSRSDVTAGWRDRRHTGGCVIDVEDDEIVLDNLSMPHSPRLHRGKLWLLNSGTGDIGWIERHRTRFEPLAFCPGFLRGLAFHEHFAVVGLSKPRRERTFSGLALDERLQRKDGEARCGLWVVDLDSGTVAHWLQIEGVVSELYDVAVLPGVRRPMAVGFQTDEIQRLITIDGDPPRLHALAATEPTARPAARRVATPTPALPPSTVGQGQPAYRRANQLVRQGRLQDAVRHFQTAVQLDPGHVNARTNLGAVYHQLHQPEAAIHCYREALAINPNAVRAHTNLALVLRETGMLQDAIRHYEMGRRLQPANAEILSNLGVTLYEDGQLDAAARCFKRAVDIDPQSATAANGLAGVFKVLERRDEARRLHERAAALDPGFFEAHENIGKMYEEESRLDEAKAAYHKALAIRDDAVLALHSALLCPPVFQSATALDAYRSHAEAVVRGWRGRKLSLALARVQSSRAEPPWDWAYHGRCNKALKSEYAALFAGLFPAEPLARRAPAQGPWHIGFVVTPGHEGVFVRCMSGLINRLDRRRFRITLVCTRPGEAALRTAVSADARSLHMPLRFDHSIAALRAAHFDVLYFWEVGTDSTNYFLPFCRLAPVQCTGWGWPDTSGAPQLDYHLTSDALAPPGVEEHFSERLFRLPHLPPYFSPPPIPAASHVRERFGLPAGATLYVCAQNLRKVHPDFDAVLGGILRADPTAIGIFVADTHPRAEELLRERWRAGLADVASRIRFLPRLAPEAYFDLIAGADVVLDTPYFGGSNTSYDAFAAGVPVVTLPTEQPRGRYTHALYAVAGIDDGVATSPDDYVDRAVGIGTDRERRAKLSAAMKDAAPALFEQRSAVTQLEEFFACACASAAAAAVAAAPRRPETLEP